VSSAAEGSTAEPQQQQQFPEITSLFREGSFSSGNSGNSGGGNHHTKSIKDIEEQSLSSDPAAVVAAPSKASSTSLILYSAFLLFSAVGNSVFFKKMTNKFPNYPYFLNQMTSFAYIPVFWGIVAYTMMFTKAITPQMLKFPKYKFFIMGALDAMAGLFMLFGGVNTSGSTQALLLQAVIPCTMILAYIVLKERYARLQYGGAFVIVIGVCFVLIPKSLSGGDSGEQNLLLFNIIFLLSDLPQAMSSVYKEIAFTEDMDVNLLQAWVALWQVLFGFALAPVNALKFLGNNAMPLDQIPDAMWNGMRCLTGVNSIVSNCGVGDLAPCDDCNGAWVPLALYLGFNMMYNIAIVLIIKYGGANLLYFVMTLRLPLVQVAFSLKFISNPPDSFHWYSVVGMLLILGGLIIYRYASSSAKPVIRSTSEDGMEFQEEGLPVAPFGAFVSEIPARLPLVPAVKHHADEVVRRRMNPQTIRSGLYGRLGIRGSPDSPVLKGSFKTRQWDEAQVNIRHNQH
jgi:drug/metabolite transporter (DMT)-like permease